jgi:hypothetical protein
MQELVPSTQSFGPFALLQLAAAVLVLSALAVAVYRGSKSGRTEDTRNQQWFFDSPLVRTMEIMRDLLEESRSHTRQLDEIKDALERMRMDWTKK